MSPLRPTLLLLLAASLATASVFGDTVYMKDGREIEGTIIEDRPTHVVIAVKGKQVSLRKQDIDTISYSAVRKPSDLDVTPPKPKPPTPPTATPKPDVPKPDAPTPETPDAGKTAAPAGGTQPAPGGAATPLKTAETPAAKTGPAPKAAKTGKTDGKEAGKTAAGEGEKAPAAAEGEGEKKAEGEEGGKEEGKEATDEKTAKRIAKELEKVKVAAPGEWEMPGGATGSAFDSLLAQLEGVTPSEVMKVKELRQKLSALGPDGVPYLARNLTHQDETVRTGCAEALSDMADTDRKAVMVAVRYLVMVATADGVMPEKGSQLPWYQRQFVQSLARCLGKLTGITGVATNPKSPRAAEELRQFADWWDKNKDKVSEQLLGEPKIAKNDELFKQKMAKIHKLRAITDDNRLHLSFSAPQASSPAEIATGVKQKPGESDIARPEDRKFEQTIPTTKDEGGGIVRDNDRKALKNFFR